VKAIAAIRRLSKQVGIPADLKSLGVKTEDFAIMAEMPKKMFAS
jgi:alcohol dehydrogenase